MSYGAHQTEPIELADPLVGKKPNVLRNIIFYLGFTAIVIFTLVTLILAVKIRDVQDEDQGLSVITNQAQIADCVNSRLVTPNYKTVDTTPLGGVDRPLLIYNATIWTVTGGIINNGAITIENGLISAVGASPASLPSDVDLINALGRIVTPGLVDLHSHLGVYPQPDDLWANSDGNEATNPLFPQVRVIDAINPKDPAIPVILSGGITSSQVLPGSANLMGGEATVVKLRGEKVQDLLLKNAPRSLKMACGENPRRVYGDNGVTPASRMGNGWLFRSKFEEAQKQIETMEEWCATPDNIAPFPSELSVDPIIALIRGKAVLHNHCYTVCDMEAMIRHSNEFGFKISAFHHAIDAWKLAPELAENGIAAAIFADNWNFKVEATDQSVYAPKILYEAGAKVVMKSDHPVLNAQYLMLEAAKAYHYGLVDTEAIRSVTHNPATTLTLGDRLGAIAVGYEADLVVWDRDPLTLGAVPDKVLIDGVVQIDNNLPLKSYPSHTETFSQMTESAPQAACANPGVLTGFPCYAVSGATIYTNPPLDPISNANIVVENGIITCVGDTCAIPTGCKVFTVPGGSGVVVPGFIEGFSNLGLVGITQESATQDGYLGGTDGSLMEVRAADGLRVDGKFVKGSWIGGVTNAITRPLGSSLVSGVSSAFHTCCADVSADLVYKRDTALNFNLGNDAKGSGGLSGSFSGQLASLKNIFSSAYDAVASGDNSSLPGPLLAAIEGTLPVFISVDSADQIAAVLRLYEAEQYDFNLIFGGAAEAHLVANRLANFPKVSVLAMARPWPVLQENLRHVKNNIAILRDANVKTGLTVADIEFVRNIRWEAGMQLDWGLSVNDALASVTSTVADIYNLPEGIGRIVEGTRADFLLFNGNPMSLQTYLQLIGSGDSAACRPTQL